MSQRFGITVLGTGLACLLGAAALHAFDTPARRFEVRERARIHHHLAGAEELMAQRDLSTLTHEQRSLREARMADLHSVVLSGPNSDNLGIADIVTGAASVGLGIHQMARQSEKTTDSRISVAPASWRDRHGVQRWAMVARF